MAATRNASAVSNDLVHRFRLHMIDKEGYRIDVYPDPLKRPTVGIGHLVVPADRLKLGDRISKARVEAFWKQDSDAALQAAEQQMRLTGITDPEFFVALADVNFQLGKWWYKDHKKTWALIVSGDYDAAAREAQDSDWYGQTRGRVEAFQDALRALSSKMRSNKK